MRVAVTGGAGFLGSHLCERLLSDGHDVVCIDSLLTGSLSNVRHLTAEPGFDFIDHDVTRHITVDGPVDFVMHLASPASPADYSRYPLETLQVGAMGTLNCLGLARTKGAGFFIASTSEVYGDPLVHPQPESYWGNVNPIGPRACYDEAKRYAEALTFTYHRVHRVSIRVVRIFNTHGPRMRRNDGRAVPTFIDQCLSGKPITIHGDGNQTRSLCYVSDLIEGFIRLLSYDGPAEPVNIGNPGEATILQIANIVKEATNSDSEIIYEPRPVDDPQNRQPDLTRAKQLLSWEPQVTLEEGLGRTVEWCLQHWRAL